eukprot:TRINITY_DN64001_c0_g1_i1.p1 TRINITY_DN64001_c0_g1~~TRINITY_DN64001_c0_g1_i1.p1  ORF type:complete len:570 (-),score=129.44 TRINITY_DN64001_c0_g1_i1:46-1722(-)
MEEVESALSQLFRAYDLDESGEISRTEFMKLRMRLCFEVGHVFHEEAETAKLTLADKDRSGSLNFEEFRDRWLRWGSEHNKAKADIISHVNEQTRRCLAERVAMGPRYHLGIRQALKRIFTLYDTSGDSALTPEEWVAAQKVVALEIGDDIDEAWVDEAAFSAADVNGDGVLQLSEFLESSFTMFEGLKRRSNEILDTLQRVVSVLENQRKGKIGESRPLSILVQSLEKPPFQAPRGAWQDLPSGESDDRIPEGWHEAGQVRLPLNLTTAEEVAAVVRLTLRIPADTWISILYQDEPSAEALATGSLVSPATLLRGDRAGDGNVGHAMEFFAKPASQITGNAIQAIYVKNRRKRPHRLQRQQRAFSEDRDALLHKRTGACWGLDWETQVLGDGVKLPPRPMTVTLGDAVVVEVPLSDENGEYRFSSNIYMDRTDVLSKPVDEIVEPKKGKKKKKTALAAPVGDQLLQFHFVALREGKCVLFVELSWEDQEEKLVEIHQLSGPVPCNTVARIGPVEVEVTKPAFGILAPPPRDKASTAFQWWNGDKWSNKKGPKKKKKR